MPLSISGAHFAIVSRPREAQGKLTITRRDDAVEGLSGKIEAKPRENTNVIDVSFESTDPVLAQRFVNTLVAVFQMNSVEISAQQARLRRQFVESQLRQNDSLLSAARFALSGFRSHEKAYSAREKFTAQASDLNQVQQQIQDLDLQQRLYTSVLQALGQGKGRESLQQLGALLSSQGTAASPIVTDLYMQMVHLQGARDSLVTAGRAPTNPDVQRIDTLMATSSLRLRTTLQGIVATLATRLTALQQTRAQSSADLSAIPASDADEARLTERESAYQKVADQLRDELQRARLSEAAEVGSVEIVDNAMRPRAPIGTGGNKKILFGALLGLFFGAGCALVIEHLDQSIRGRDDVETTLQLPGLAVIPRLEKTALAKGVRHMLGNGNTAVAKGGAKAVSGALVTVKDSRSVGAEAYRTLRTKLLFSRALSSLKTIVVTSPFAQEGKSTVAANLATTFAQHGMRTLIIDCDLRRPTQHEIFGVSSKPGLTELLMSEALIPGAGRRTSIENLSLITAGALPPDPPELVGSTRMRALLEKLGETFDVIVLDTPPVLPVADSAILASLSDGVLLVVRAGQTDRRAAQLAVQQLQDVDARILGAVLNDPNEQVPIYDQYGYATYYGYANKE
jgi:capsular exopolysaccharide synthesis family protein